MSETDRFTDWLTAGGEMGERILAFDWSKTPIGPIETWSAALRMMVRFLLANGFPMLLWWGPDYISLYNDAYRPILGEKHPWGLGQPLRECWKEIWHILQPLVDTPFNGGAATYNDDILLEINRHGFTEETRFTVAYSPVPDETVPSSIGGVLAIVHEITEKVVGERRVGALRDLGAAISEAKTADEACRLAAQTLVAHARDIPFAVLYLKTPDGKQATLAGCAGTEPSEHFCPAVIELDAGSERRQSWPLGENVDARSVQVIDDLASRFGNDLPSGPWSDPPRQALILPIRTSVAQQVAGFLVGGVSARLKLDEAYRGFYELLANQIGIAVANARAYDEERRLGAATDITDRRKADNTRQLLLGELNHRVKNTLASVQAIAAQTLRYSKEPSEFAARFSGRIQSLSRVHSLLTDMTWHGADLNDLIDDQLLQGTTEKTRLTVSGPTVHLDPQTAVLLALMLHELGTNSAKYGAMSSGDGQVALNWSAVDDTLNLQWIERGGPRVTRPTRLGFGTMLIEQSVKSAGGRAEMLCEEGGITWKLAIKLPHVETHKPDVAPLRPERPAADAEQRAPRGTKNAPLNGLRLLVIEDEPLIALELVAMLEGAGADAAGSVGAEGAALATVAHDDFDCVLLDANLHGRSVDDIAATLTRRRIPFIFISGYGRGSLPIAFRHIPALEKPVNDKQLTEAILKLVAPTAGVTQLNPQSGATKR